MCMYILKNEGKILKPRVAEEDIECFKVVAVDKDENMYSAVRRFPYQLNETYTVEGNFFEIYYTEHHFHRISEGGFHSIAEMEDVLDNYTSYTIVFNEKMVIVRCHIPKGSLYYMGKSLSGEPNYVSQSIVIDEIIHGN